MVNFTLDIETGPITSQSTTYIWDQTLGVPTWLHIIHMLSTMPSDRWRHSEHNTYVYPKQALSQFAMFMRHTNIRSTNLNTGPFPYKGERFTHKDSNHIVLFLNGNPYGNVIEDIVVRASMKKLSFWRLAVRSVIKNSSKWHFHFVELVGRVTTDRSHEGCLSPKSIKSSKILL